MNWKKRYLRKSHLYLISDGEINTAKKSLDAGVDIVQLRIKDKDDKYILNKAKKLKKIVKKYNKLFIINDKPHIAMLCDADGVHLGQNDIKPQHAKKVLGPSKIVGLSTHSKKEAKYALEDKNVDYVGIGPAFKTKTKPNYKSLCLNELKRMMHTVDIPYFVIGGINEDNIDNLIKIGVRKIAVSSAITESSDPKKTTENLLKKLTA